MIDRFVPARVRLGLGCVLAIAGIVSIAADQRDRIAARAGAACPAALTIQSQPSAGDRRCQVFAGRIARAFMQTKIGHWTDMPSGFDRIYHLIVEIPGRPAFDVDLASEAPVYDDARAHPGASAVVETIDGRAFSVATSAGMQQSISGAIPSGTGRGIIALLIALALALSGLSRDRPAADPARGS